MTILIVYYFFILTNELPQESDQFRFFRTVCLAKRKGSVGLILGKDSVITDSKDFYTARFVMSHTTFSPFPRPFSSVFCLSGTCCRRFSPFF
jgi:hypothetical protein